MDNRTSTVAPRNVFLSVLLRVPTTANDNASHTVLSAIDGADFIQGLTLKPKSELLKMLPTQ